MSSQRGNPSRSRPQKYQNNTVFKKDLYGTTPQTKALDNFRVEGLCSHCKKVIEWKIKFLKYKKLTAPSKCAKCLQRTVKEAYHTICRPCAELQEKCPKCCGLLSADAAKAADPLSKRDPSLNSGDANPHTNISREDTNASPDLRVSSPELSSDESGEESDT